MAAILYDQECSGIRVSETTEPPLDLKCPVSVYFPISFGIPSLIERMLLIDYGIEVYPVGSGMPETASWVYRRFFQRRMGSLSRHLAHFARCCRLGHVLFNFIINKLRRVKKALKG